MSNSTYRPIPEWLWTLPKVELHVHLEGTIAPQTLVELDRLHGHPQAITSVETAAAWYRYADFPGFIDAFTRISDQILTADDLGFVVEQYGADLARQGVRYAEVHYNAEPHLRRKGIALQTGLRAMNDARQRVLDHHGVELRWIVDGVRDANIGPKSVDIAIDWIVEAGPDSGIVALGLGGNEIDHPARKFARSFQRAHDEGINVVAHAGEAVGPTSIWETLEFLNPARIGHGVAAAQDEKLMDLLTTRGIPLEVCPTSNVRTGVVASYESVPLRRLREKGVRFSISSDDPPMFGTDLITEYAMAIELLGMSRDRTIEFLADTINQSFAPADISTRLHDELKAHSAETRT